MGQANVLNTVADTETSKPRTKPQESELKQLQELYDLMVKEGLESLELKDSNTRIRLDRARSVGVALAHVPAPVAVPVPAVEAPTAAVSETPEADKAITAPLAGVFYRAASPARPAFVKEGDTVETNQTLCIVEAMKVMNEIKADRRCRIVKILAENSRPVSAGQVLFQVEAAA